MRIGFGYDLHKIIKGNGIVLGGINIPCNFGLKAHSDGDVVLHALMDALLGSVAMGDIGSLFPPDDKKYNNIDSKQLLVIVLKKISQKIKKIINIDIIINAEKPKLSPYQNNIKNNIAQLLELPTNRINIKIKSGEGIGIVGEKKAIASYVAVLVEEQNG